MLSINYMFTSGIMQLKYNQSLSSVISEEYPIEKTYSIQVISRKKKKQDRAWEIDTRKYYSSFPAKELRMFSRTEVSDRKDYDLHKVNPFI